MLLRTLLSIWTLSVLGCSSDTRFSTRIEGVPLGEYFELDVRYPRDTSRRISLSPEIRASRSDSIGRFIQKFQKRFSYILWNRVDTLMRNAFRFAQEERNDSAALQRRFRDWLGANRQFRRYAAILMNANDREETPRFTLAEMMMVGSRFFYYDLDMHDSTLVARVCVAFSGLREFIGIRDYAVLEAFCFEAIFDDFEAATTNYYRYGNELLQQTKANRVPVDSAIRFIREQTFRKMQTDPQLRDQLQSYYQRNKGNLGFVIE